MKGQLKKVAITASNRKDKVFLGVDMDRAGFISKANLREMCQKQHLPCDDNIIDRVSPPAVLWDFQSAVFSDPVLENC